MKLIFEYCWVDDCVSSGRETIPFEYSSIEDFQFMVLEKIKEYKEQSIREYGKSNGALWYRNGIITLWDETFNVGNLEDSITNVSELNDWFEGNKQ
jgi:hypothetical protein